MDFLIISSARDIIGETVIDRTGLTGRFDVDIEYVRSTSSERLPELGVSFQQAIIEQLHLKTERRSEPVDVLIVDRVTMPSTD